MEPSFAILLGFSGLLTLLVLIIFIVLVYQFCNCNKDTLYSLRILALLFVLFCIVFMGSDLIYGFRCFPLNTMTLCDHSGSLIHRIGCNVFLILPAIILYSFLVLRLRISFRDSIYKVSVFTTFFLIGLILIAILLLIIVGYLVINASLNGPFYSGALYSIILINDMILHSIILSIFLQKLRETTLALFETNQIRYDYKEYQKIRRTIENSKTSTLTTNVRLKKPRNGKTFDRTHKNTMNQSSVQNSTEFKSSEHNGTYSI